jgi:hypothetical protein
VALSLNVMPVVPQYLPADDGRVFRNPSRAWRDHRRGRPKGSRNKSKCPGQHLLDEYAEQLVRTCIALAMQDRSAMRIACQSGSPRRIHPNESAVHPDGQRLGPGCGPGNASHPARLHHAGRRTNADAPPGEPVSWRESSGKIVSKSRKRRWRLGARCVPIVERAANQRPQTAHPSVAAHGESR